MDIAQQITRAAAAIQAADALIVTAGAGMGVDSGLPDFRGQDGFWGAYPALGRARLQFQDIACPGAFVDHPRLAWGFYGHRLALYRRTVPHDGFQILRDIAETMPYGCFVFTSNVDGQFQKAGFPAQRICEVHGSIHHLQCIHGCRADVWSASSFCPEIDEEGCYLLSDLPHCPHCGALARPNILMFGDPGWLDDRTALQMEALLAWRNKIRGAVVIEIGAGSSIPTARAYGEGAGCPLIRINWRQPEVSRPSDIGIPLGGLEALQLIGQALKLPSA
jgi:NAD-dependent SIR2 family protein deacetylase